LLQTIWRMISPYRISNRQKGDIRRYLGRLGWYLKQGRRHKNSVRFHTNERLSARKAIDAPPTNPATTFAPTTKGKENPYAKPRIDKCYRCGEPGHMSNECSKRSLSTWQTMRMNTRCWSRPSRKTPTLLKRKKQSPAWSNGCYAAKRIPTPYKGIRFLLKVFGNEQCLQSHHWQRQLWKYRLYRISGLFEVRDGATPSPLHHWVDKEWPMHKVMWNGACVPCRESVIWSNSLCFTK